jgi:hypothetical protein
VESLTDLQSQLVRDRIDKLLAEAAGDRRARQAQTAMAGRSPDVTIKQRLGRTLIAVGSAIEGQGRLQEPGHQHPSAVK